MPVIAVFVSLAMLPAFTLAVTLLIMRHIDIIIPPIADEIDRLAASIIFAAVFAPFFLMTRRYVQIDWLSYNVNRCGPNNDWFCVNKFRPRIVSDVNAAIKAGLADADRHTDIGGLC